MVQLHGFHFMKLCKPGARADLVQTGSLLQVCLQRQNLKITNNRNNTYVYMFVKFEVLPVVKVRIMVFLDVTPCSLVGRSKCFGRTRCLHLHGTLVYGSTKEVNRTTKTLTSTRIRIWNLIIFNFFFGLSSYFTENSLSPLQRQMRTILS